MTPIVNLRPIDQHRAGRLLLGRMRVDRLALHAVLMETAADPIGTSGLLFANLETTVEMAYALAPEDAAQQIERALAQLMLDHGEELGEHLRPDGGAASNRD